MLEDDDYKRIGKKILLRIRWFNINLRKILDGYGILFCFPLYLSLLAYWDLREVFRISKRIIKL